MWNVIAKRLGSSQGVADGCDAAGFRKGWARSDENPLSLGRRLWLFLGTVTSERVRYRGPEDAIRLGAPPAPLSEAYYLLVSGPWWRLLLLFVGFYLLANFAFATLYYLDVRGISQTHESFSDAFFFSVQTISTIGYGAMSPQSPYAHALVTMEALVGLVGFAMVTGLMFAKFSRPTAHFLFSSKLVISRRHGKPVLMLRVANARGNEVVEASVRLAVLVHDRSPEGHNMRRIVDLNLIRSTTPVFALSWLIIHEIDENSPLYNMTPQRMEEEESVFFVTLVGLDSSLASTVHGRHVYDDRDVVWGHRFVDIISRNEYRRIVIDFGRFHDTQPDPLFESDEEEQEVTPELLADPHANAESRRATP